MTGALLFDFDGCLVDSLPSIRRCWERTLPQFGVPVFDESQLRHIAGPPLSEVAGLLLPGAGPELIAEMVAAYRRCSMADAGSVAAFPGVPEMLDDLRARGVRLGLATSKSMEVAEPVLESLGLRGHFAVAEGTRADELGTAKDIVVGRALAGLAPDRPVGLVGDRRHDIEGAHANGIAGFGVLWGYGGREELETAGADALIAEPADVAALVG